MSRDDRKQDLIELRRIAEAATPGPWHQGAHYIGAGGEPHDPETHVGQAALLQDAVHIGTFGPLTVLALIDRLERAEAAQKSTGVERLMQAPAIQAVRDVLDYYADEIDVHIWQEIASVVDDIPDCESATAMPHDEHAEPQSEPTDDEREALLTDVRQWSETLEHAMPATETLVSRLARFVRRSGDALAEMTAEKEKWRVRCAEETIAWADEATENRRLRSAEPRNLAVQIHELLDEMNAEGGRITYSDYCVLHGMVSQLADPQPLSPTPEPQGEPTDSQVQAFLLEEWKHESWAYDVGDDRPYCRCGTLLEIGTDGPVGALDRHRVQVSLRAAAEEGKNR